MYNVPMWLASDIELWQLYAVVLKCVLIHWCSLLIRSHAFVLNHLYRCWWFWQAWTEPIYRGPNPSAIFAREWFPLSSEGILQCAVLCPLLFSSLVVPVILPFTYFFVHILFYIHIHICYIYIYCSKLCYSLILTIINSTISNA